MMWLIGCLLMGCDRQPPSREAPRASSFTDGWSGAAILDETRKRYRQAPHYRDEARVYLSYRLNGQLIQEQQPWSIVWSRDRGMKGNWFNAELQYDGHQLRCYVYHIESENLGQQCLMMRATEGFPLQRFLSDAMAAYFAGGRAEMPLDARQLPRQGALVSPVIGWLIGDDAWELLAEPERAERLEDGLVDGRPCFHLRIHRGHLSCDLWIDRVEWVVRQMTLPVEFLDPAVRQTSEVNDIQFFARMHGATFGPLEPDESFAITIPPHARLVRQFISLPEPFPLERLGQPMPTLNLFGSGGQRFHSTQYDGRIMVFFWVADENPDDIFARWSEIIQLLSIEQALSVHVVLADDGYGGIVNFDSLADVWRNAASRHGVVIETWRGDLAENMRTLGLKIFPGVMIVAPDGTLQYAQRLGDNEWFEKLGAALRRIGHGDRLAEEMRQDYQGFLERYHRKLQLVSADSLASFAPRNPQAKRHPIAWRLASLARPGNIQHHAAAPDRELIVFDGWRTLVLIDFAGREIERKVLQIPVGEAVSSLRQLVDQDRQAYYAVFTPAGRGVFLLDGAGNSREILRSDLARPDQVVDCQFVYDLGFERWEVWVAYLRDGLVRYGLDGERIASIDEATIESLAADRASIGSIARGALWFSTSGEFGATMGKPPPTVNNWHRIFVARAAHGSESNGTLFAATRNNPIEGWQLVLIQDRTEHAVLDIGSQVFDSSLEPFAATTCGEYFAIADALGTVQVYRHDDSSPLAVLSVGEPLNGLAIARMGQRLTVVTATHHELIGWEIER